VAAPVIADGCRPPRVAQDFAHSRTAIGISTAGGGLLIDPASANTGGPNKSVVENNIVNSFDAFEDNDEDGAHD
jgi:hypothetical protein